MSRSNMIQDILQEIDQLHGQQYARVDEVTKV